MNSTRSWISMLTKVRTMIEKGEVYSDPIESLAENWESAGGKEDGGAICSNCDASTTTPDTRWRFLAPWLLAGLILWVLLAWIHQVGAAWCAFGASLTWALETIPSHTLRHPHRDKIIGALAAQLVMVLAYREWTAREHLPVSDFEQKVTAYLDERGEGDAMLVASHQQEALQARTGHPIMVDMATITWIAYKPSLGPTMEKVYGDLYGIHFAEAPDANSETTWFVRWMQRSQEDWLALSKKYDFTYVISPDFATLQLPKVVEGEHNTLYHVPGDNEPQVPAVQ